MRPGHVALATLAILAALGGCGPSRPATTTDGATADGTARHAHEAYTTAINSNNLDSVLAIVTDDVAFLSPNEPVVAGKAAFRSWAQAYLKAYTIHWDKTSTDLTVAGDWAFELYSYREHDTPKGGGAAVTDTGKGLVIYHHDADGRWRVARDAWSSDLPAPTK